MLKAERIWVTGSAGFIGFHVARRLLDAGCAVTGLDGFTPYYDVALKRARHAVLARHDGFTPVEAMLQDGATLARLAADERPKVIVHLAAQAGVRYGLEAPATYVEANLDGLFNVLEAARIARVRHLLFASTSSVYGANASVPFRENDRTDHPLSLYGATKKAGEAMAHAYAHLWAIPTTCLRFFTVYGPWGRPDMALFKFVEAIERNRPIDIYGDGRMQRDFTYIDDIVNGVVALIDAIPERGSPVGSAGLDSLSPMAACRIVNIGAGRPQELGRFIEIVERVLGRKAKLCMLPMQPGDVPRTYAATDLLETLTGLRADTPIETGIEAFVAWYHDWRATNGLSANLC